MKSVKDKAGCLGTDKNVQDPGYDQHSDLANDPFNKRSQLKNRKYGYVDKKDCNNSYNMTVALEQQDRCQDRSGTCKKRKAHWKNCYGLAVLNR